MKPVQIKCKLISVTKRADGRMRSTITLLELGNQNTHEILVDESIRHVRIRLQEQFNGDSRDGIYLTKGMTNVDINTKGDIWDINQEDWNWYTFSKDDVLNAISNIPKIEINLESIKEISDKLIADYDAETQELTVNQSDRIVELSKKHLDWFKSK